MSVQAPHFPHGSALTPVSQLSDLAKIRAIVVLPTPRVPVNRNAWWMRFGLQRVRERAHHVLLPDQLGEALGPPLAGEDLVGHRDSCAGGVIVPSGGGGGYRALGR